MKAAFRVGAVPVDAESTRFTVWAPRCQRVAVSLAGTDRTVALSPLGSGYHGALVDGCGAGTRYGYLLDGEGPRADPASRSQPDGVHGPSEVVDLGAHRWGDGAHRARPLWQQVVSEVHIGTLTEAGTFDAAVAVLDELAAVGVSAVEVMPVAQFPGRRNWGYDGVFPFAVQNSYGGPAGLQRFVDACHGRGLDVILDVVYNHLGPEGNVFDSYGPYLTDVYRTPWGPAVNFDRALCDDVRAYFVQNACQWLSDYHVDGLRLDAVHEIVDRSARPFLAELSDAVEELEARGGRRGFLIAESADNDPRVVRPTASGGLGMDGQWNDDFHHALHAAITGERTAYYRDFGAVDDIARAMDQGFVYQGEHSEFRGRNHGAPSTDIAPDRFVLFAQNHDQIGNRPRGDRLVTLVSPEQAQLAAALLLLAPGVPLLFMGEEYGEPAPFPYFIDHGDQELIESVRAGRAREFAELGSVGEMLDPADEATFVAARPERARRHQGVHRHRLALCRALIALRRTNPALGRTSRASARASVHSGMLTLVRSAALDAVVGLFNVSPDAADAVLPSVPKLGTAHGEDHRWTKVIDARAPEFGGVGGTLPHLLAPGDVARLGPWEFCAYHLSSQPGEP